MCSFPQGILCMARSILIPETLRGSMWSSARIRCSISISWNSVRIMTVIPLKLFKLATPSICMKPVAQKNIWVSPSTGISQEHFPSSFKLQKRFLLKRNFFRMWLPWLLGKTILCGIPSNPWVSFWAVIWRTNESSFTMPLLSQANCPYPVRRSRVNCAGGDYWGTVCIALLGPPQLKK